MSRAAWLRLAPIFPLLLVFGSVLPFAAKNALAIDAPVQHRVYHAISYGMSAWVLFLISRNRPQRVAALLGMIGFGAALEGLQHMLFHCAYEWWDVRDDAFGICAAFVLDRWPALRSRLLR
jgi:hypothetical protein